MSTISNVQRYEEYQDSPTTMAKQPWLLKDKPILLLNSNTTDAYAIALRTQHQQLWYNKNLPNQTQSENKSSTKPNKVSSIIV